MEQMEFWKRKLTYVGDSIDNNKMHWKEKSNIDLTQRI